MEAEERQTHTGEASPPELTYCGIHVVAEVVAIMVGDHAFGGKGDGGVGVGAVGRGRP